MKKNIWSVINLILGVISLGVGAVASLKDNENMKQEIIDDVIKKMSNKEA